MVLLASLQTICLIAFGSLLIVAAWQDLRTMRIANKLSAAIVAIFAVWAVAGLLSDSLSLAGLGLALGCAIVMFGLGALAFAVGAFGGGDVKLLAATSLFAGPALLPDLLLVSAFVGGALGCAIMAGLPLGPAVPASGGTVAARLRGGLPYGPAIAAGGLWTIFALAG